MFGVHEQDLTAALFDIKPIDTDGICLHTDQIIRIPELAYSSKDICPDEKVEVDSSTTRIMIDSRTYTLPQQYDRALNCIFSLSETSMMEHTICSLPEPGKFSMR